MIWLTGIAELLRNNEATTAATRAANITVAPIEPVTVPVIVTSCSARLRLQALKVFGERNYF